MSHVFYRDFILSKSYTNMSSGENCKKGCEKACGWRKTGLECSVICTCCPGDACENSADIFAGSRKEEGDDHEYEELNFAKLLAHEFEEDNENLEEEEIYYKKISTSVSLGHLGHRNERKTSVNKESWITTFGNTLWCGGNE
ncbi:hypothetical protein JTB14_034470 [Gonioctena quinquepunctata]|nr:hypothetical protein JTB14_034470 [Gonioctena quinquepunctata]